MCLPSLHDLYTPFKNIANIEVSSIDTVLVAACTQLFLHLHLLVPSALSQKKRQPHLDGDGACVNAANLQLIRVWMLLYRNHAGNLYFWGRQCKVILQVEFGLALAFALQIKRMRCQHATGCHTLWYTGLQRLIST